jgi:hypothetical protein
VGSGVQMETVDELEEVGGVELDVEELDVGEVEGAAVEIDTDELEEVGGVELDVEELDVGEVVGTEVEIDTDDIVEVESVVEFEILLEEENVEIDELDQLVEELNVGETTLGSVVAFEILEVLV